MIPRRATPLWLKLAAGLAASGLLADRAYDDRRQEIVTRLGRRAANAMLAAGIPDGAARWRSESGWTHRIARLSGTATPTQRAQVERRLEATAGIAGVEWRDVPR